MSVRKWDKNWQTLTGLEIYKKYEQAKKLRELIEKEIQWIVKNDDDGSFTIAYQTLKKLLEESKK